MAGERIKGETDLSYTYFCLYRDQSRRPRSLADLCTLEVQGKKRTLHVFGRWSKTHEWQRRVNEWDAETTKKAARKAAKARQKDIEEFIKEDFMIGKRAQRFTTEAMVEIQQEGTTDKDVKQFRMLGMGYQAFRPNLIELLGLFDEEAKRAFED